jgi:hypothetical protein
MSDLDYAMLLYDRHFHREKLSLREGQRYLAKVGYDYSEGHVRKAAQRQCQLWMKNDSGCDKNSTRRRDEAVLQQR